MNFISNHYGYFIRSAKVKGLKYLVTGLFLPLVWAVPTFAENLAAEGIGASGTMVESTPLVWWVAPFAALLALAFAYKFHKQMMASPAGTDRMQEIAGYVREGAYAYLFSQYKVVFVVFVILAGIFTALAYYGIQNGIVPIAFFTAGICSAITGLIGMNTATLASNRTAWGASNSLNRGLQVAFRSGAVMGLSVVGFGLLVVTIWYLILDKLVYTPEHMQNGLMLLGLTLVPKGMDPSLRMVEITNIMVTFGMGASTQALFARVGGGIYTKAADVGADLVGKVEAGIPEDDPRNPATIADNVGDNVGDVAGMGADLFESYINSILAAAALGAAISIPVLADYGLDPLKVILAPTMVAGIGIILSIVGVYFVRCKEGATQIGLLRALLAGTLGSSILIIIALALMVYAGWINWGLFGAVVAGLVAGVLIGQFTEYFTSSDYKPTKEIAEQANLGAGTALISGFANGMYSSALPVLAISGCILTAFGLAGGFSHIQIGLYGIGFAAVGMLATLGITLATDAYGPIADNAGGNAEMSGLGKEVRERTDALDALGNTTAATGKGFAIGSAALTALALLAALIESVRMWIGILASKSADGFYMVGDFKFFRAETGKVIAGAINTTDSTIADLVRAYDLSIMNPKLNVGLFIGCMMAFVFSAMAMKAVGRAAGRMVEEVRRQFKAIPGIMEGTAKPDYAQCVAISTRGAQREMILPSLLAIIIPVATGLVLGVAGVMGLLAGGVTCGFVLAVTLNNAGGAWDNAKKYIEKGAFGGKGSPAHKAAVIGDTVGDPFKDTSGPSLNILIKLMSMVAVVFSGLIVKFGPVVNGWLGLGSK
jgi:K(+)-stimulated pyrophosphate-energized sodium pump